MMKTLIALLVLLLSSAALAQTTRPTTRPMQGVTNPDDMLKSLLTPAKPQVKPLEPLPDTPKISVDNPPVLPKQVDNRLHREGEILFDRRGRLNNTADGQKEFIFEADGQALQDPPMILLPNLKLMAMENFIKNSTKERTYSITGAVTEYNGRNYILLDKVVVVPE